MTDARIRKTICDVMATLTMLEAQAMDILDTVANERAAMEEAIQALQNGSTVTQIKVIGVVT